MLKAVNRFTGSRAYVLQKYTVFKIDLSIHCLLIYSFFISKGPCLRPLGSVSVTLCHVV